jgi:GntR family transcriptional regulator/MocR family aminotransferase
MSKTSHHFSLPIRPPRITETLSNWLYRELRDAILEGRLKPGALLPPTRPLAAECGVARGTVVRVFEQLLSEGYLESRVGSGTTVHREVPDQFFSPAKTRAKASKTSLRGRLSKRGEQMSVSPFLNSSEMRELRAFRANQPSVTHFPIEQWSRLSARRTRLASREMLLAGDVFGYRPLREAIAAHLGATRGVICDADRIMIVSGAQQALDLIARMTLDPGDEVWMEDPGYPGATAIFRAAGAKLVPVPVDAKGLQVLWGIKHAPRARLAYVTPANQYPLCVTLPLERRLQLLEWSHTTGGWIFEDDYDSEFRFNGRPLTALQGLAPDGNVIFSGSFSKILYPSLRMGYLVAPPHLVDPLRAARSVIDRYGPLLSQAVLCDFIVDGHFGRHLRRMRQVYSEHLDVLKTAAGNEWGDRMVVQPTRTGLQTVGWLSGERADVELARAAHGCGVEMIPLSTWALRWKRRDGLQLGFAAVGPAELRRGVQAVAKLL